MRKKEWWAVFVFTAVLTVGGVAAVKLGHHQFSANENRYLTQFPTVSISGILSGEVQEETEEAYNDQFPARDSWTALSTRLRKAMGMKDIGGVYFGKDHYYFEKVMNQDISQTQYFQNLRFLNHVAELSEESDVTAMLVPSPGTVLEDKLPTHAVLYDAQKLYDEAAETLRGVTLLDIRAQLREAAGYHARGASASSIASQAEQQNGKQIYYRTDHHWTQYGAYLGYCAYMNLQGREPESYDSFGVQTLSNAFYGTLYSKALDQDAVADRIEIPETLPEVSVVCDGEERDSIYKLSQAEQKDKYAVYFGGNYGEVVIRRKGSAGKNTKSSKKNPEDTLLVIKDSFANSMVPFLLQEYTEIRMIDLRYLKQSFQDYLEEHPAGEILVLYEMSGFAQSEVLHKLMQ